MRQVERRIRALEAMRTSGRSRDAITHVPDDDLEWMLTLPNDGARFERHLFTAEQAVRFTAIWAAANSAAASGRHGRAGT